MREGGDVEMLDPRLGGFLLNLIAGKEQAALVFLIGHAPWPADEHLLDARHRALRLLAQHAEIDWHLAPAEEEEVALRDDFLGDRLRARLRIGIVMREEDK